MYHSSHGESYIGEKIKPYVLLITDAWDDYYEYETLFRAKFYPLEGDEVNLGEIKIASSKSNITRKVIPSSFEKLDESFCSLAQDISFYQALINYIPRRLGVEILNGLNDIASNKEVYEKFSKKEIITSSLMRFSEAIKAFNEGSDIIQGIKSNKIFNFTFITQLEGALKQHNVDFDFEDTSKLPNRINVMLGANGTGKTRVLSELACKLSGITKSSNSMFLDDKRPSFSRIIAISYSAFDDFNKPFFNEKSRKLPIAGYINKLSNEIPATISKLKNIWNENELIDKLEMLNEDIESIVNSNKFNEYSDNDQLNRVFSYVYCGIRDNNGIVSESDMYHDLESRFKRIKERDRFDILIESLGEIIDNREVLNELVNTYNISNINYKKLSSGQAITMFVITSVIENIEEESLLMFDEPEIHLHPNSISNFMRMVNSILDKFDSYAIISTHSPLIVQEIPAKYVRVFDRLNFNIPIIRHLNEECFGENISNIVRCIFDVSDKESNYKNILKNLSSMYSNNQIQDIFENK